jgi:hypothetical protein
MNNNPLFITYRFIEAFLYLKDAIKFNIDWFINRVDEAVYNTRREFDNAFAYWLKTKRKLRENRRP